MTTKQRMARGTKAANKWNEKNGVGIRVNYHPVVGEPPTATYTTRTEAQVLASGQAVVWLDGKAGCVAVDALTVAEDA